jgi:predicted alpha/beta-hydrolase family hydrolase
MDSFRFAVDNREVSALALAPATPRFALVLAHGAGAGMAHPFLENVAQLLLERNVATLRYQFPYMESGSKRPDSPKLAQATVRAAVAAASERWPGLPLVAGGKSFGGRMTSQAQAQAPLSSVRGLAFFGFPLHPPDAPGDQRGAHLSDVTIPMLFLQGTRDEFAQLEWLEPQCAKLGARATLRLWQDADHSFHVPAKSTSGKKDAQVRAELCDALVAWAQEKISP